MGSFFPALQTQLPAQALGQSVGAVTAYEQLSDIRNRRQAAAEQAKKQALIQQLHGRAALGDRQALQGLLAASPETGLGLLKTQQALQQGGLDLQTSQAQLGREQLQTQDAQRADAMRKNEVARRMIETVRSNPENPQVYQRVRSVLESQGVVPSGTLPEQLPTEEQLNEFETQVDIQSKLLADPAKAEELKGELADINAVYPIDTAEGRALAERLIKGRLQEREARTAKSLREDREAVLQAPPGLTAMGGRIPTKAETTEVRDIVSGIAPVIETVRDLQAFIDEVGFQPVRTDAAAEGESLASLAQLQLKDALKLGALDAQSEVFLRKLLPSDPTQVRQGLVKGNIRRMLEQLENRLRIQARVRGFDVDINQVLGTGGSKQLTRSAINPDFEKTIQRQLQAKGYSPKAIDMALSRMKRAVGEEGAGPGQPQSAVPQVRQMDDALQQLAVEDPTSFVQQRLDSGADRETVIQELQQIRQQGGPQAPSRREPAAQTVAPGAQSSARQQSATGGISFSEQDVPQTSILTIPSVREQITAMPWVRKFFNDPSLLSDDEAKQVIRETIEGKGIVRAIDNVKRRVE